MTIGRLGNTEPIQPDRKPGAVNRAGGAGRAGDSISISQEARERSELLRARELVAAAPDVRAERVAELKRKINDPSYINERMISATADRILDVLLG